MKIYFTKNNGPIDEIIEKLMETAEGYPEAEIRSRNDHRIT